MATKTPFELTTLTRRHDLGRLLAQLRKVFGVDCRLPTLPTGLGCRDTRIVLPTLVHGLVRTIGQLAPGDGWDGVEDRPILRCVVARGARIGSVHAWRTLSLFRHQRALIAYGRRGLRIRSRRSRRFLTAM